LASALCKSEERLPNTKACVSLAFPFCEQNNVRKKLLYNPLRLNKCQERKRNKFIIALSGLICFFSLNYINSTLTFGAA